MKMNTKFSLALIAIVGIGVFALPSTVALFAGQHSFYNIDATGNQIPCVKCHGDVKAELSSGGSSTTGTEGPHANFQCEYCHRIEQGSSSGDNAYGTIPYTAKNGTTTVTRYLAVSVMDMEAGNYPAEISNLAANASVLKNLPTVGLNGTPGIPFGTGLGTASLSPSTDPAFGGNLTVGALNSLKLVPTYDAVNHTPLDTNPITQNKGLDLSLAAGWTRGTGRTTWVLNLTGAGSKAVNPGASYHAASLVSCMECHGGDEPTGHYSRVVNGETLINNTAPCQDCHYGNVSHTNQIYTLWAGGFGLTTQQGDTGTSEAHNDFVRAQGGVLRYKDGAANDACVACHTHVAVDINFQKKYVLKFNANAFQGGAANGTNGTWGVGGFTAQGTVNVEEFGNGTGGAFATTNHSYNWTPTSTLYLINGTAGNGSVIATVSGLNNAANDSQAALVSP